MIHGFRGTYHGLGLIAQRLMSYRTIVPDLLGFGESISMNGEYSIKSYVLWLNNFITKLNLKTLPIKDLTLCPVRVSNVPTKRKGGNKP